MDPKLQATADERYEAALTRQGGRDPREFYRERLRALKTSNPDAYKEAVVYYSDTLVPSVASEQVDPLVAWMEYGARLCTWSLPGRAVEVDPTGVRHPHQPPTPGDRMVLHIPDDKRSRALVVGLPAELSPAQRATFDLLVQGRLKLG